MVILNWNGKRFLGECLLSLEKQSYPNFETIVVDNASIDGSIDYLKANYSDFVKLLALSENRGFAGGNNVGIRAAKGKYVILLNNDTRVDPRWLEELVRAADRDENVGMCASKIYFYDKPEVIDNAGLVIYKDGLSRGRGRLEKDSGQFDREEEVIFPSGCAALYKRDMLDEIGLFDEDFFLYLDDTDLGLKARLAGWKCIYVPTAVVYHKYSGSTSAYSPQKGFYVERNRIWVLFKYFPMRMVFSSIYFSLARYILQGYGAVFHKGAAGKFTAESSIRQAILILARAYISALRGLPMTWKKRKEIKKIKKISRKEWYDLFKRFGMGAKEIALKD